MKSERAKIEGKLDKEFSRFVRMRFADENGYVTCCTCNRFMHWKEGDCGHFMSRRHKFIRWNDWNALFQCKSCNSYRSGEQYKMAKSIDSRFGIGTAQLMDRMRHQTKKWTIGELREKLEYFKEKANRLERSL